jgi:hypothetical protein
MSVFRIALIPIAMTQFLAPLLPIMGFGQSIGDRATAEDIPPELPLGLFFSIWGVIFTGYLTIAVLANLRPKYRFDHLAGPLALAGLGNVIWMISAQSLGFAWLDCLLLFPILFFAWEGAYRLDRMGGFDGTGQRLLLCLTIGLLAGWLSVAVSISLPEAVRELLDRGATDRPWQSLWIALGSALVLTMIFAHYVSKNLWFFVAAGWGISGIVANNWLRTETHLLGIAASLVGLLIVAQRLKMGIDGRDG